MNDKCRECNGKLIKSGADGEIVYINHAPHECIRELRLRLERKSQDLQITQDRLRNLRHTIEDEMRFRAKVGQMDEEKWIDRFCTPDIRNAILAATA